MQKPLAALVFGLLVQVAAEAAPRGALALRALKDGDPVAGVTVVLAADGERRGETNVDGRVFFGSLAAGTYRLVIDERETRIRIADELVTLHLDLSQPFIDSGRFGRSDLDRETLASLPHAGTLSSVLETIEPFAITNRIDVAGVESATDPLWSVRGSSWTQNRIVLDGIDITDPSGGAALLYLDTGSYEVIAVETSAASGESASPGAEIRLVTKTGRPAFGGSLRLRYTGRGLQSENLSAEHLALGIEPREMLRYAEGSVELGSPRFYASASGFDLKTGIAKFEGEEKFDVRSVTSKVIGERASFIGILQQVVRPTFGARPDFASSTTLDAKEGFQIGQATIHALPLTLRFGYARGNFESSTAETGTPVLDLATGARSGAPPIVFDRERERWAVNGLKDWAFSRHLVRAGFEVTRASEAENARVPRSVERLTVDGVPHAVSLFSGGVTRRVGLSRVALYAEDAFFVDALGRSWRLSPGARLDVSRGGGIRWTSLSGAIRGGMELAPSTELHFSAGTYPHALTTRFNAAEEALSWVRRRWADADDDGELDENEIGDISTRGGGAYTSIDEDVPRPVTYEMTIGIEKRFRRGFLRFSGYQRWERRLLQTVNVGIDPESYRTFFFHDVGIDGVLESDDDVRIPVHDQVAQFGEDRFLLTHPEGLGAMAQGVDLLLGFDHGRFSWRLSGRAYRDVGSGNPGNEAELNDTGIIGELFDDPNTLTNAEGRLFFDRAFTGKLALTARGPFGLRLGTAIRYWDGQPFARHLFFPELGQGFVLVQAFPRGRLRYAFNMTVDVRVERDIELGRARIGFSLDAFNLANQALHTAEVVRSGMNFRDPTFVQPARTIVLEGRLSF